MKMTTAAVLFCSILSCLPTHADDPAALPEVTELKIGDSLTRFEAVDDSGQAWKSDEHIGKKVMVIYFYPGDFTPGCTRQAEQFRDQLQKLTDFGVEVIGVSGDSAETHKLFKEAYSLKHTLLADPDGSVAKHFGVPVGPGGKARLRGADGQIVMSPDGKKSLFVERTVTAERWTFVFDAEGSVISKRKVINPAGDTAEVLELVKKLP